VGALLPGLDPTVMGWKERDWYLGGYAPALFDTAGNAGPTVWWDGRIVGGWRQGEFGEVQLQMLEDIGNEATRTLEEQASGLEEWLDGRRVLLRFPSPLWRELAEPAHDSSASSIVGLFAQQHLPLLDRLERQQTQLCPGVACHTVP